MEEGRCSVQAIRWLYVWGWHVVGMLLTCQDILHGRYSWQVGGCRWQIHGKYLVMPGMFLSFTTLSVGIKGRSLGALGPASTKLKRGMKRGSSPRAA